MSFKRLMYLSLVVLVAVAIGAVVYVQRSLPDIARDVVQTHVPGGDFADLDVGFTQATMRGLSYVGADGEMNATIAEVQADFDLFSAFGDEIRISEVRISQPHFQFERLPGEAAQPGAIDDDEERDTPQATAAEPTAAERAARADRRDAKALSIGRIAVRDGTATLVDKREGQEPYPELNLRDISLDASNITRPLAPGRVPVDLRATIDTDDAPGQIGIQGWIDRPADAGDVQISAEGLPMRMLTARIDNADPRADDVDGRVGLDARLRVDEREFRIEGSASLAAVSFARPEGDIFGIPVAILRDYLDENDDRVEVDFSASGNLDEHDPRERLAQSIAASLVLKVGADHAAPMLDRLREGDMEGAEREYRELRDALRERLRQSDD